MVGRRGAAGPWRRFQFLDRRILTFEPVEVAEIVDCRRRRAVGSDPAGAGRAAAGCNAGSAGAMVSDASATVLPRSARTPRPTSTPHRKITTDTTVAAMNKNTNCLPFSWIS